jgi:peptide/nickel transport system permease protein
VVITITLGAVLGIVSGMSGGVVVGVVGRLIDLTLSFPSTLMLLALSSIAVKEIQDQLHIGNRDIANGLYVVVVLAAFGWPPVCRVVRGQVLSLREREFVEAATLFGASKMRMYFKEILPYLWAPLLVYFTLTMPSYISAEAALNYLGVGIKPPTPTLGNILTDSITFSVVDPFFFFTPAIVLAIIVVSFNLLGDGIRDALDPKSGR